MNLIKKEPMTEQERQKRIDQGWKIYRDYIVSKTARAIKAGLQPKSLERLYLAEQGIKIINTPILPTGVMV